MPFSESNLHYSWNFFWGVEAGEFGVHMELPGACITTDRVT